MKGTVEKCLKCEHIYFAKETASFVSHFYCPSCLKDLEDQERIYPDEYNEVLEHKI